MRTKQTSLSILLCLALLLCCNGQATAPALAAEGPNASPPAGLTTAGWTDILEEIAPNHPTAAQGLPSAFLKATNAEQGDRLGYSVAISTDTLVIGAPGKDSGAGVVYIYTLSGTTWQPQAILKASNAEANDAFGGSVAISGDTVAVGASGEDGSALGGPDDNSTINAGGVYIFVRSGTSWSQQARLKASNAEARDSFGTSVSISGETAVVGAPDEDSSLAGGQNDNSALSAGAAYVFARSGTTWSQQAFLKASNAETYDTFGYALTISGETLAVGAFSEDSSAIGGPNDNSAVMAGAVYVFIRSGTAWSQQAYLKGSNTEQFDLFGWSVAISGETLVVGARGEKSNGVGGPGNNSANSAGAAYVFVRSGTTWSQQAYLKASNTETYDDFGWSVAVSGDTIVVGAAGEDSSSTGGQSDNSTLNAGAAYVYVRSGTTWIQQAYLKSSTAASHSYFGEAASISGNNLVIGAEMEINTTGAAYVFTRSGTTWEQKANSRGSTARAGDNFGYSVATSGVFLAVGTPGDDSIAENAGAVYIFMYDWDDWQRVATINAPNAEANDRFGWSVSISGAALIVGAPGEDSSTTGGPDDNSVLDSGAVYYFTCVDAAPWNIWEFHGMHKAVNAEPNDGFGSAVAFSANTLVVGAPGEDSSFAGGPGDNSAEDAGAAYVFGLSGTTWTYQALLKAANADTLDSFGQSVGGSGMTVVVGAPGEDSGPAAGPDDNSAANAGASYIFTGAGSTWSQQARLKAANAEANDQFGFAVSVFGSSLAVGAPYEDSTPHRGPADNTAPDAGAAYVFMYNGTNWNQKAFMKAFNAGAGDQFGYSIVIDQKELAVGAPGEDSNPEIGPGDNSAADSGATYLFSDGNATWVNFNPVLLKAPNANAGDRFGYSVTFADRALVVGAPEEDSSPDLSPADNSLPGAGAAYTYQIPNYLFLPVIRKP